MRQMEAVVPIFMELYGPRVNSKLPRIAYCFQPQLSYIEKKKKTWKRKQSWNSQIFVFDHPDGVRKYAALRKTLSAMYMDGALAIKRIR